MTDLSCPVCGTELDMAALFAHEADQRALARLASVSIPLGARVLQYITLFTPPKTRLTAAKKIKLLLQLLPDLERGAIHHKGREWQAPHAAWAAAIDQMIDARNAGRLELPMKGHGYLYTVIAGMANQFEAAAEAQREHERRAAPQRAAVQIKGHAVSIGQALQVGAVDPALADIEQRTRAAAPMPDQVRERLAQLKKGGH